MNSKPCYYHVTTPDGLNGTWVGGKLVPDGPDYVWLTKPDGQPLLRVRREHVRESSAQETAERLRDDGRASRIPWN